MVEVQSGDIAAMRDATMADLVDDMNAKQAQIRLSPALAGCAAAIGALLLLAGTSGQQPAANVIGAMALLATVPAWMIGAWLRLLQADERLIL